MSGDTVTIDLEGDDLDDLEALIARIEEAIERRRVPDPPAGAQEGERITFRGEMHESLVDGNVWLPVGYPAGWRLVTD